MQYKYTDEKREHLHTLDGKPLIGTSTVAKMAGGDKGGLIWWAAGCAAATFGWLKKLDSRASTHQEIATREEERFVSATRKLSEIKQMEVPEFQTMLDIAYKAHNTTKLQKGKEGTARHGKLEDYVKECMALDGKKPLPLTNWLPGFWAPEIEAFIEWSQTNVRRFLWSETNCFSHTLWVGGIADIGYEDMQGRVVAGDHKSSKDAYMDQFIQIAGYDLQLSENGGYDSSGNKTFELPGPIAYYAVFPFGSVPFTPKFVYDVEGYREGFRAALTLHKLSQGFTEIAVS